MLEQFTTSQKKLEFKTDHVQVKTRPGATTDDIID